MNYPAFHKKYQFVGGKSGQDLDKQYTGYTVSCFLWRWGRLRGRRDISAIYSFWRSVLAQLSVTLFSKPVFVIMMVILCICSHTEKHR